MFNFIINSIIPLMILFFIIVAMKEKKDVYQLFIEGVVEGIKIVYRIFPYILGITIAIGLLKSTKALDILLQPIFPLLYCVGIPKDIVPLMLFRPLSGGASMALVMEIFNNFGPDSISGKIASIIMGATETTLYTMTILFSAIKIKKIRGTLIAGLLADITVIIIAVILVNIKII
jgi:spore maturation protein B